MPTTAERLDRHRAQIDTRSGSASYIDSGGPGRPALFVHGLATSSYLWRNVIADLDQQRRCVAIDLPLHGQTPAPPARSVTARPGPVRCRLLRRPRTHRRRPGRQRHRRGHRPGVRRASHPDRLHTLTLTNCEAHNNVPPPGLRTMHLLARADQALGIGLLARLAPRLTRNPKARSRMYQTATRTPPTCPTTSRPPGSKRSSPARPSPPNTCACSPPSAPTIYSTSNQP